MASTGRPPRSKRFGDFVDARVPQSQHVKRWDGAARTCDDWDNLRRDPELWLRNGNCLVHLYGKGQSRRGPSFKIPLSKLLDAKCYPLIERSIDWEGIRTPNQRELTRWSRKNPSRRVDLYIPPPSMADKSQAYNYHVATRNFFAWVFRRSMVGHTLGDALVGLLHSMHEFRSGVEDNVQDLMAYLDEEGYLDMANQPNHALALLHVAEFFQMKGLYTRAFAHSVGMSDRLFSSTEYQQTSQESRKAMRRAQLDMNRRLTKSSTMLKTFLDDELSEAHLGIPSGARAHLERFRSFLLSFYATKLGYYPPRAVDPCRDVFDVTIYRRMREDFEALYDLLVDDEFTTSQTMPSIAHGGICTIQLVHSFDERHDYEPLEHPLPLLPEIGDQSWRLMSWIPRREKPRPERRLTAHGALTKAANWSKPGVSQNELVRAYRRFEENSVVSPNRADKQEKVSLVDARKVRWILVYAIYQVLRSATNAPREVEQDIEEASYSLSVSTTNIPPWREPREMQTLLRRQTEFVNEASASNTHEKSEMGDTSGKIEIKPDIDYFALTHKEPPTPRSRRESMKGMSEGKPLPPSRSNSLKRALSRSSTIRRSMRMFKSPSPTPPQSNTPATRPAYHEIVVHGYGNGTNKVNLEAQKPNEEQEVEFNPEPTLELEPESTTWDGWDDSTIHQGEEGEASTPESMESTDDTLDSPLETPPLNWFFPEEPEAEPLEIKTRQRRRDVVSMVARSVSGRVSKRRPISAIFTDSSKYAENYEEFVEHHRQSRFGFENSLPRSFTRHSMILPDLRRKGNLPQSNSMPVHIQEQGIDEEPYIMPDDADWTAMQAFMDNQDGRGGMVDGDVMPAWEQYADLGGLTEMR